MTTIESLLGINVYFGRNPFRSLEERNNIYGDFMGETLQKGLG